MNKHLDNYLCKKYPKIFADRNKSMQETCMCWGFEHGNGWFFLIDQLCASIQHHIDNPQYVAPTDIRSRLKRIWNTTVWNWIIYPIANKSLPYEKFAKVQKLFCLEWDHVPGPPIPQVVALQVKEKFGGLRFYVSGGDDHTHSMIQFAESLSYAICEKCGRTDELVSTTQKGWMQTVCPCCAQNKNFQSEAKNEELINLWKVVREEETKRTKDSEMAERIAQAKEVKSRSKKQK